MKPCTSFTRRRHGFTLLELLVVIGIIAVLAAMLFPAIQRMREMANRTKCVNNLHQMGIAMSGHFGTHQCYPTNGMVIPSTATGYPFSLTSFPGPSPNYMWGMGDPTQGPKTQPGSWAYAILPYLEETNAFRDRSYFAPVSTYLCPSRGRVNPQQLTTPDPFFPGGWTYNAQNVSTNPPSPLTPWGKTDYAANYLMFPDATDPRFFPPIGTGLHPFGGARNYPVTSTDDIKDGTSTTIVIGEKAMPMGAYSTGGWYWDEPFFAGGSGGTSRGVPSAPPVPPNITTNADPSLPFYSQAQGFVAGSLPFNYPSILIADNSASYGTFENNWGSPHPGGVNFLFADGSVRTFNFNIDPYVFRGLLTPDGGQDPTPKEEQ
jgi:prepilin-type N-terminal cleavage/methylation domain-containing protein/prepilin-type processing-associated H-X9-DG protein